MGSPPGSVHKVSRHGEENGGEYGGKQHVAGSERRGAGGAKGLSDKLGGQGGGGATSDPQNPKKLVFEQRKHPLCVQRHQKLH